MLWRRNPIRCEVSPGIVRPGDTITVRVVADAPIDRVDEARIELGYTNFYSYRWAGRADSAAGAVSDTLSLMGEVGTNYGGERNTSDWVSALSVPIAVPDGLFRAVDQEIRVPSWSPASSSALARWECHAHLTRARRNREARCAFQVVVGKADQPAPPPAVERMLGDASEIEIAVDSAIVRAGEAVTGLLTVIPTADRPDADIAVYLERKRLSHPLARNPGGGESQTAPIVKLGMRVPMPARTAVRIPFEVPVPADAAPSAAAVHSSLEWSLIARIYYKGFSTMPERVRRRLVVVNAD
ncbi:hypothetical protein [Nocardia sp. NPDC004722]